MEENIKIIVNNIVEDESGVGGLWDLAREMAIQALGYPDGDMDLNNAIEETQERFYNTLLDYASYTDPEHYSNRRKVFLNAIDEEYEDFRKSKLVLSKEKLYDDAYEIYFYKEIHDYFQNTELDEDDYKLLLKNCTHIIHRMWEKYLKWEWSSAQTYGDIDDFVREYLSYLD